MASHTGINLGNILSTSESIKGAKQRNMMTAQRMQDDKDLRDFRTKFSEAKTPEEMDQAFQGMVTINPDEGKKFVANYYQMDEKRRMDAQRKNNKMANLALVVQRSADKQKAWNQIRSELPEEDAAQMGEYSPAKVPYFLARAAETNKMIDVANNVYQQELFKGIDQENKMDQMDFDRDTRIILELLKQKGDFNIANLRFGGSGSKLKAADINTMLKMAGSMNGAMFDDQGNIAYKDKTMGPYRTQRVVEKAAALFSEGKVRDIVEAINKAQSELGYEDQSQDGEAQRNILPGLGETDTSPTLIYDLETGTMKPAQ
jgi:hypothetical protein